MSAQLNGEATPNVRGAFDMFDLDGSGEISVAEFGTVIRSLGENPTDDEIEEMLKVVQLLMLSFCAL